MEDNNDIPKISVVICTYNREKLLPDCLKSLVHQIADKKLYEVIIVNNNSTDDTRQIVEEFTGKYSNFRLVDEPEQGLSHARNRGLHEAKAEWVAYMDDDARASENWLETAFGIAKEKSPDIFGGPVHPLHLDVRPKWYKDEYGIIGNMGETGWIESGFLPGSNIIFKKGLLEEYGGFDTGFGMKGDDIGYHEETDLVYRAFKEKKKVFYSNDLIIYHLFFDYKYSLAFTLYKKYKAGTDGLKLWNVQFESYELLNLLRIIDQTMSEFDVALRKRDESLYPYPENYIVERVAGNFFEIGKRVAYFLRQALSPILYTIERFKEADILNGKLRKIEADIAIKDAAILLRDTRIESLENEKKDAVAQRDARIASLENEKKDAVAQRDARIVALENEKKDAIMQRDARIASLESEKKAAIAERDGRIAGLENEKAEAEGKVEELLKEKTEIKGEVEILQAEIKKLEDTHKEETERFKRDQANIQAKIVQLQTEVRKKEEEQRAEVERLATTINRLTEDGKSKDEYINELLNSMSWKITASLRSVYGMIRRQKK